MKYKKPMDRLDTPEAYEDLTESEKAALIYWIQESMTDAPEDSNRSSYGIKHDFQANDGFYITNGQFKGAMLAVGYTPKEYEDLNWIFKIKPIRKLSQKADPSRYEIEPQHHAYEHYTQLLALVKQEDQRIKEAHMKAASETSQATSEASH